MTSQIVGGVDVSRETFEQLQHFRDLALKWTKRINLVANSTTAQIWDRHIVDSIQLFPLAPKNYQNWVDIGSGGGFPGIVLAILAKQHNPAAEFTLIESDQRKCTFLRTVKRELDLNATVLAERIETASPIGANVASARALADLSELLPLIARHLAPTGRAILPKGRRFSQELAQARQNWSFDLEEHPSLTDPDARLLVLEGIHRD